MAIVLVTQGQHAQGKGSFIIFSPGFDVLTLGCRLWHAWTANAITSVSILSGGNKEKDVTYASMKSSLIPEAERTYFLPQLSGSRKPI